MTRWLTVVMMGSIGLGLAPPPGVARAAARGADHRRAVHVHALRGHRRTGHGDRVPAVERRYRRTGSASSASRSTSRFPSEGAVTRPCGSRRPPRADTPSSVRGCAALGTASCAARFAFRPSEKVSHEDDACRRRRSRPGARLASRHRRRAEPCASANRWPGFHRSISKSSGSASTISSRSRHPRKVLVRRSTARAAPSVTTCRSSAEAGSSPRFAPRAETATDGPLRSHLTARRCSSCSPRRSTVVRCSCPRRP